MSVGRALKIICVGVAGGIVLRTVNMLYSFNYNTGFFTDGGIFAFAILAFLLIISVLCIIMIGRDSSSLRGIELEKSVFSGVISIFSAFVLIAAGIMQIQEHVRHVEAGFVGRQYPVSTTLHMALCVGLIVFGGLQICTAANFFSGKNLFAKAKLLYLLSGVWTVTYLLYVFVNYSHSSSLVENIYTVLGACGLLLSLFYFSKLIAGVGGERTAKSFYIVATPTVMINMTYTVSNTLLSALGNTYTNFGEIPIILQMPVLLVSLFLLVQLFTFKNYATEGESDGKGGRGTASTKNYRKV